MTFPSSDTSFSAHENPYPKRAPLHVLWAKKLLKQRDNQNSTKETKGKNRDLALEERQPSPVSSAPSMTSEVSDFEDKGYFHQDQLESIDASNGLVLGRFERAARRASPTSSSSGDESSSEEELDDELGDEDELFDAGFEDGAAEAVLWNLRKNCASQEDEDNEDDSHDSDEIKSTEVPASDDSSVTLNHEPGHRPGKTISAIALSATVSQAREEARKRTGDAPRKLAPKYPSREEAPPKCFDEAICQLSGKPASLNCNNRYIQAKQTDAEAGEESSSQDSEVADEDDFTPFDLELDMNGQAEQTDEDEINVEHGEEAGSQVSEAAEEEDSTPSESDMGKQAEQTEDEDSDAEPGEEDSSQDSGAAEESQVTPFDPDALFIEEYIEPEDSDDEPAKEDGSQVSEAAEDGSQASDAAEEDDPVPNDNNQSVSDEQSDDVDSDVVPLRSSTKRKRVEDIEDIELELKKSKLKREYRLKQVTIKHRYDVKDMELRHELSLRSSE